MAKLAAAFPPSFPDDEAIRDKAVLWRELLDSHPWVTSAVFRKGIYRIAWEHKGGFLPEPATALDFFEAARFEVRREQERRDAEQRMKLAAPVGPDVEGEARVTAAKEQARAYLRAMQKRPGW